ncbi:hypothetical protein ACFQZS_09740 [Mucilaginibacter calamicampi]|uniref:Lipoprotein n=1 Tax=Mucilaginibacter calamicampi TaxID=1302352 RepID=A0ABW2YYX2_9SPHI
MKRTLSLIAVVALIITSCKKSGTNPPANDEKQDSYQPVATGSYWKYNQSNSTNVGVTATMTITMTGETLTANSLLYYKATAIKGTHDYGNYFYHDNGDYLMMGALTGVIEKSRYLKDDLQVGQTWEDSGVTYGYPIKIVGKIIEKGINRTVSGKQYTNVIHSQLNITQSVSGGPYVDFQTSDFYIAKGIGLIEIRNMSTRGSDYSELTEYSIK